MIAGVHRGFLELIAHPEITGLEQLRQRRVGIDIDIALLGGYQGVVVASDWWLHTHGDQARAVIRSLLAAIRWGLNPAHREALIPMLQRCVTGAEDPELASRIATGLFGPVSQ
ncbi:hypothetical protein KQ313_09875 [Synechococcus sp. CS-1325]|uniref:hypothetical protein n=1 Tax=Synechococcus sp. CS-1325 TaxID=2847979 RepID=UPI000DB24BE7|nr:hypothetical protein [Synechococcus sp. CS-1325]MCT0199986.1 hypothetical protein [Synechococcus sp. CS-1325]PZU96836.1 MAG: hypothetical protein DCF24_13535 [Cyanobium sp.]